MFASIIGTKGLAPLYSKRVRKYTQARIVSGPVSITIDAGNTIRNKSDLYLISHLHEDHIDQFHTIPAGSDVWVPSASFIDKLKLINPDVRFRVIQPGQPHTFKKFSITPFSVQHSSTTETFGWVLQAEGKKIMWLSDFRNLLGVTKYMKDLDYLFIGSSALRKDIEHSNHDKHGQMAIMNSLNFLKIRKISPNKIILIHFGIGMDPIDVKTNYVQTQFPEFKIDYTWDGRIIRL
jgi:L-ascorbate metabolism protein UlaG (beta-lactamase superfamily)